MKKFLLLVLTCCLAFGVAMAQDQSSTTSSTESTTTTTKKAPAAPLKWLKGTISDDGKSFTADKDKSTWSIKNPDDVKGHEGHHVKVQAHVYKDDNSIHVMKVEMVKAKKEKAASSM
jgi:hypothetical protein